MAQVNDYKDLNIRWKNHPKYKARKVIEDDAVEVIVQKLEMILYTKRKDVLGQEGFDMGVNLEYYLWKTKVNADIIKDKIENQINRFIPELNVIGYKLDINIFEGTIRDILELNFTIKAYNISFVFN